VITRKLRHVCLFGILSTTSRAACLEFVTRKITHGVDRIKDGTRSRAALGNLQAKRDGAFAGIRARHVADAEKTRRRLLIGTGRRHTVEEFVTIAFRRAG